MSQIHEPRLSQKLFRDVASLARRFEAATAPNRAPRAWTPPAVLCAAVLTRLAAVLATWGTHAAERSAKRLKDAIAAPALDVSRLVAAAARFLPAARAAELAKNVASALADGIEDPSAVIPEMIAHRRAAFGLAITEEAATALESALVTAATAPGDGDVEALGVALGALGRAFGDCSTIQQRMRAAALGDVPAAR